jgi:aryl-alcohol dehydrogenase-like predicted oxidoreductase
MKQENLKGTNLMVSTIALGSGAMGTGINQKESEMILDAFIIHGGNFIDTANIYGRFSPPGEPAAELAIGRWMKKHHLREKLVLCTKGAARDYKTLAVRLSPEVIRSDLENSMQNLQTDYFDLYYLHKDNLKYSVGEIMETMADLYEQGKFRYFGLSNWSAKRMREAREYCLVHDLPCFSVNEVMMSLAEINEDALKEADQRFASSDICEFHKETGIPMTAYSAPAWGFFERYGSKEFSEHPRFERGRKMCINETNIRRVQKVRELAAIKGLASTDIVFGYLYAQPFQVIPIIGPNSVATLMENINHSDTVLTMAEIAFLFS